MLIFLTSFRVRNYFLRAHQLRLLKPASSIRPQLSPSRGAAEFNRLIYSVCIADKIFNKPYTTHWNFFMSVNEYLLEHQAHLLFWGHGRDRDSTEHSI